ncbi:uncharacterized protein LOC132927573 [Rhopalosiphum padi]|uniref:uncharacterized protein LOC132927573 n=1 Tax=Rhopalosiphum padi TaxID=40932 RepID=UPI00298ECB34|nr:uncharacterized protein LOC132927573 [Rhopalosiphum padi]
MCFMYLVKFENPHVESEKTYFKALILHKPKEDHYTIFRKTLIYNIHIPIQERLDQALKLRTDTYLIKFHNMLLYYHVYSSYQVLTPERYVVVFQSYYYAASTYYFYKECELAHAVINSGLNSYDYNSETFFDKNEEYKKHAIVWHILFLRLKIDIMKCIDKHNTDEINEINELLKENEEEFDKSGYGFPSSAVLLFRSYFLDYSIDENEKNKLKKWLTNDELWLSIDDDPLYKNYISMYKFLVFYHKSQNQYEKISNLFEAIKRPVLSTEDRLLNYEAIKLISKDIVRLCIDSTELAKNVDICKQFDEYKTKNTNLMSKIIPKLHILHKLQNIPKEKFIEDLYRELNKDNYMIQQDVLHLIMNAAIDIDTKSNNYETNIENVKLAIRLLNSYVKGQKKTLSNTKKCEQENLEITNEMANEKPKETIDEKTKVTDEDNTEETDKEKLEKKESIKINYDEESTTKYLTAQRINNLFIAYKWLIELNGVLSNNSKSNKYQNGLLNAIKNANNLMKYNSVSDNINLNIDEHFNYLQAKQQIKILIPRNDWESSNRSGDWKLPRNIFENIKAKFNFGNEFIHDKLTLLESNYDQTCLYINKIELYTLMFRYHRKYHQDDYDKMYEYIKKAINEIVITPEDRIKNLEAHELFTMFLMDRNEVAIKKANVTDINTLYNDFLKDPDQH